MTDHDPIPDPAMAAALQRWAAATDPATDLVGGPTIRAGATGRVRWTSHRTLLVAAAVLGALLVASAVWAVGGDDPDTVITDPSPTEEDGVRLDVVVDTGGVDLQLPNADRAVRLEPVCDRSGPCPDAPADLPQPVELGVSLVWSGRVPAGSSWDVVVDSWTCDGHCPVEADGTPPPDDQREPRPCRDRIVVDGPTVAVLGITTAAPDTLSCGATVDGPMPKLTVPPSFTLRERYPWSCGVGAVRPGDAVAQTPEDEQADIDARACLADIVDQGGTAELPVQEIGAADGLERSWWRTSPDEGLVVVRAAEYPGGGRWYTEDCAELVEDRLGRAHPDGCGDPRELDVVYEPPTAGDQTPTTTAPPADGEGRELVV
ncbi:MAG TPA: hypothetical protein VK507_12705, partial [Iamia sp.]|nr:hypothetical protein [Iamia sp.]